MGERIAIIGGESFTAKVLAPMGSGRGHEIIKSQNRDLKAKSYLDLRHFDSFGRFFEYARPTSVVLLAGIAASTGPEFNPYFKTNVMGAVNLARFIDRRAPYVRQLVFASSAHVYGSIDKDDISEDEALNPQTNYGISKFLAETMLTDILVDRLTIVRPFNYTGVGQGIGFLIPKLVDGFVRRRPHLALGNTWPSRDFSDVRDIADMYLNVVEKRLVNEVFNFCSGKSLSVSDIIDTLKNLTGQEVEIRLDKNLVRPNEPRYQVGSIEKAVQYSVYSREYEMVDTLEWMISEISSR